MMSDFVVNNDEEWEKYKSDQMKRFEEELRQSFLKEKFVDTKDKTSLKQHLLSTSNDSLNNSKNLHVVTGRDCFQENSTNDNEMQSDHPKHSDTDTRPMTMDLDRDTVPKTMDMGESKMNVAEENTFEDDEGSESSDEDTCHDRTFYYLNDSDDTCNDTKKFNNSKNKNSWEKPPEKKKKSKLKHRTNLIHETNTNIGKVKITTEKPCTKKTGKFFYCENEEEKVRRYIRCFCTNAVYSNQNYSLFHN